MHFRYWCVPTANYIIYEATYFFSQYWDFTGYPDLGTKTNLVNFRTVNPDLCIKNPNLVKIRMLVQIQMLVLIRMLATNRLEKKLSWYKKARLNKYLKNVCLWPNGVDFSAGDFRAMFPCFFINKINNPVFLCATIFPIGRAY